MKLVDFASCISPLLLLEHLSFTHFQCGELQGTKFRTLKPQLIRIGNIKINVSGGQRDDGLYSYDFEGIRSVLYISYCSCYPFLEHDYPGYYACMDAIKALPNVKLYGGNGYGTWK